MTKKRIALYAIGALLALSVALVVADQMKGVALSFRRSPAERLVDKVLDERPAQLKKLEDMEKKVVEAEGQARAAETRALAAEASAQIYRDRWETTREAAAGIEKKYSAMKPVTSVDEAVEELNRRVAK